MTVLKRAAIAALLALASLSAQAADQVRNVTPFKTIDARGPVSLVVRVAHDALERLGLGADEVNRAISTALAGQEVVLSSHEYDLLLALAAQAGQILSREFLFNHIYNREYDGLDRTIDVRISQLRKKLNDNPDNPTRIKTIWGKGCLFIADAW